MKEKKVEMTYAKSTKGTHVYQADSDVVTSLYIKRTAFAPDEQAPVIITVTITETD